MFDKTQDPQQVPSGDDKSLGDLPSMSDNLDQDNPTNPSSSSPGQAGDVDLQDLNQGKKYPFKKLDSPSTKPPQPSPAEDIFATTDKGQSTQDIAKPMATGGERKFDPSPLSSNVPPSGFDGGQKNISPKPSVPTPSMSAGLPPDMNEVGSPGSKKKGSKALTVIIIVLVVIILAAIGYFVFASFLSPQDNGVILDDEFSNVNSPDDSLTDVLKNLSDDLDSEQPEETDDPLAGDDTDPDDSQDEDPQDVGPQLPDITDTDGDGLLDSEELKLGSNPSRVDTDFDGLSDYDELNVYATSPVDADSDGDGYLDGLEIENGYDPMGPGKLVE